MGTALKDRVGRYSIGTLLICASLGACGRGGSGGQPIEVPGALAAAVEQLEAESGISQSDVEWFLHSPHGPFRDVFNIGLWEIIVCSTLSEWDEKCGVGPDDEPCRSAHGPIALVRELERGGVGGGRHVVRLLTRDGLRRASVDEVRGDDVVVGTVEYSLATSPPRRIVLKITWSRYLKILVGIDLVGLPVRFVRSSASTWKPRG